jgi:hypothetical protein
MDSVAKAFIGAALGLDRLHLIKPVACTKML